MSTGSPPSRKSRNEMAAGKSLEDTFLSCRTFSGREPPSRFLSAADRQIGLLSTEIERRSDHGGLANWGAALPLPENRPRGRD